MDIDIPEQMFHVSVKSSVRQWCHHAPSILLRTRTTRNNTISNITINHTKTKTCNKMEHSEDKMAKHAITPHSDSIGGPSEKRQKVVHPRQCDCGLQFCHKGDIQATLHELNCRELLEFKQVYACSNHPLTHIQRKHFAFRKSVEFHLKIPFNLVQAGKRYYIHKFHWPIMLLRKLLASTSLLTATCIKDIEDQQRLLFGITNEALRESRNTYENVARDVLVDIKLSRDEMMDLNLQVQAPVSSRDDIIAYIHKVSSERSQRHVMRPRSNEDSGTTASFKITPGSPSFVREGRVIDGNQSPLRGSPSSPLAPRTLLPPTPQSEPRTLLPPTPQSEIVTTPETIIQELRHRFQNHLLRGHVAKEFLEKKGIENAWKSLFHVHGLRGPIPLAFDSDKNEMEQRPVYWLIFCMCGHWAEIGQALKKYERICLKCKNYQRKEERRRTQIEGRREELAHPSSRAPYSSLATPVKVERYQNVRKLVKAEKRRYAHLKNVINEDHAKTLDSSDEKAIELVSVASQFLSSNSDHMVNLIKDIIMARSGIINKSEHDVTVFAENCVNAIKNFTKAAVNGQEKQVRFSPLTLRAALSLWMRNKKGYAVHRNLSLEIMPSQSTLKGILQGNRVNEGKCAKLYGWFNDNHVSKCDGGVSGHLMHDELKLVNDVYWNCSNNHMVGLAASAGEFNQLLPETEVANLFLAARNNKCNGRRSS